MILARVQTLLQVGNPAPHFFFVFLDSECSFLVIPFAIRIVVLGLVLDAESCCAGSLLAPISLVAEEQDQVRSETGWKSWVLWWFPALSVIFHMMQWGNFFTCRRNQHVTGEQVRLYR